MKQPVSDIAFTPTVKAVQERLGSRDGYASMEQRGGWNNAVTPELAAFIAERDTMFIATANADGQPYYTSGGDGKAPTFMVYALRDAIGANLDRIQIIKGWQDGKNTYEKVYDVSWSGGREADGNGKLPAVGNTVDAKSASWTNTIGSSELGTVWTDPDFDPKQRAFYYARVLEIPTPRWSTYDAFRFGVPIPEGAPISTQERAYTSPIWYTP